MRAQVTNAWYPVAWSDEISATPIRRTVLGMDLVLFRTEAGHVRALRDLCPHRMAPLSRGRVRGECIECAYHGLRFDGGGRCVLAPGQDRISDALQVRSFPVHVQYDLVWVWTGEDAPAPTGEGIVTVPHCDDPRWRVERGGSLLFNCHYLGLVENLCDPRHATFLHPTTLGDAYGHDAPVSTTVSDRTIVVARWIRAVPPVASLAPFLTASTVDRWQYYNYSAPCTTVVDFGTAVHRPDRADQDVREDGLRVFIAHCITPVDDDRCIDNWFSVRNFGVDDDAVGRSLHDGFRIAYNEDREMLEAIHLEERKHPDFRRVRIMGDAGPVRMRMIIDAMAAGNGGERGVQDS